jgi:hypothetical protein
MDKYFLPRLALLFWLGVSLCPAQSQQATIAGTVTDAQQAAIVDAEVVAVNSATGVRTPTRTNEAGYYTLNFLPIGDYELLVTHTGFRSYVRKPVALSTGQTLQLNITLELGAVSESVSVSATASTLQTMNSDINQLVESKTIEDMPLGDRRSMNMINMVGAAVFVSYDSGSKPNFSLAGGRTQSQMLWIDGGTVQNTRLGVGQMDIDPPIEVLQEVKIISNGYSAEYGASAGGVVVSATKSGTNEFHGSLFEYLRNQRLDAANFFAPVSGTEKIKAPLRYNVFGGTIGGPVRHNQTFFFFGYEGARRRDGYTSTLTVPTDLQRAGDFSQTFDARGVVIPIYDPNTTRVESGRSVRDQFPGNRIPANRQDPVAVNIMPLYPQPNKAASGPTGANNYSANGANAYTRNNFTAKVDHSLGAKNKFTGRYMYNSDNSYDIGVFPNPAVDTINTNDYHQQIWFASWTRTINSSTVNEARFAWDVRFADTFSPSLNQGYPGKLGLKGVPDFAFPQTAVAGFSTLGGGTQRRYSTPFEGQQFVDNLSWFRGKHSMKFGAEARRSHITDQLRSSVSGAFTFNTLPSGLPGVASSGNGAASLLLGFPSAFSENDTPPLDRSSWYLAAFAQDDWSVTKSLTLNLGMRWETDTPILDSNNQMNGFDPTAINPVSHTPGVVKFAGVGGWRTSPYDTDWNNFGPREDRPARRLRHFLRASIRSRRSDFRQSRLLHGAGVEYSRQRHHGAVLSEGRRAGFRERRAAQRLFRRRGGGPEPDYCRHVLRDEPAHRIFPAIQPRDSARAEHRHSTGDFLPGQPFAQAGHGESADRPDPDRAAGSDGDAEGPAVSAILERQRRVPQPRRDRLSCRHGTAGETLLVGLQPADDVHVVEIPG